MLVWGARLVRTTWHQVIAEFPLLSVGVTYLPLPLAGFLTLLFIIERVWIGEPPRPRSCTGTRRGPGVGPAMDAIVLLGAFAILCAIGMPVAYTLGLAASSLPSGWTFRWRR